MKKLPLIGDSPDEFARDSIPTVPPRAESGRSSPDCLRSFYALRRAGRPLVIEIIRQVAGELFEWRVSCGQEVIRKSRPGFSRFFPEFRADRDFGQIGEFLEKMR